MPLYATLLIFCLCSSIIGYLFGNLMWSIIIGKIFFQIDPRNYGSQNPGATNSSRLYGKKVALIILFLDILKAVIPVVISWLVAKYYLYFDEIINYSFNPYTLVYLSGFFAVIGHMWPIFFKLNGGKGVATFGGLLITIAPFLALIQLIILLLLVLWTKYVSLSSLISCILAMVLIFVPAINYNPFLCNNITDVLLINFGNIFWLLVIWTYIVICAVLIWIKHRKNILLLLNNKENKFFLFNNGNCSKKTKTK